MIRRVLDGLYLLAGYAAGAFMVAIFGLVIDWLDGRVRRLVEIAALVVGTGFIAFFAWHAVAMNYDSWRFGDMSQGVIAVPLWIPQLGYSGGLVILLIAFVD